jgi:uncharacterized tellurite resistance protein B-like protein
VTDANMILTLGKVIIAAAWADGEVTPDEVNSLKDLLFHLPGLTGREWASLEMYIESPVGAAERERLVAQLKEQISSGSDKALALQALDDVVAADGVVGAEERQVVDEIKSQIEGATVGVIGALGHVIRGSIARRSEALSDAPNREDYFDDFIKNKVFYSLRLRMAEKGNSIDMPEKDLRKLSLAGGLMARVAQVDRNVTEGEIQAMVEALDEGWSLGREESAFVAEVAVTEVTPDMDYYRLTRQFFTTTSEDERVRFLDVLFSVAVADGTASNAEIEEIRAIARALKLTHQQFIDAKLKIPKELRET